MNIELKAKITLTADDIKEAITQYVSANGFDLEGKEVEFVDSIPETITLEADGTDQGKAVSKPKTKAKAKPTDVKPVDLPEPEPVEAAPVEAVIQAEEAPEEVPAYKQGPSEDERAAAKAEAEAAIKATQELLNTSKPKPRTTIDFSSPKVEDVVDDTDSDDDTPFGQDVLDAQEVKPAPTRRVNTDDLFGRNEKRSTSSNPFASAKSDPAPQDHALVQPTIVRKPANANRLFG